MGYDNVARLFHWATVLLVLVMIPVGLVLRDGVVARMWPPLRARLRRT